MTELDPFPYGVASFEPTASGVLLWTRATAAGPVDWELATDEAFSAVVETGRSDAGFLEGGQAGADAEASHVVSADGLTPGADHFYRFSQGGRFSPVGRTRTLPDDDRPIRLGLACCGDYSAGHFAAYRALADADIDAVVHLGDYVYAEVEGDLRPVDPTHEAITRDEYRCRYAQVRLDPDLQALHQRHPMFTVADDHDLADNAYEDGAKTHDPETEGPWSTRRDGAVAERSEWLPVRTDGPPGRSARAQWRSVRLGELGELVLLDTRLAGRDRHADDEDGPDLDDSNRSILGSAQMAWVGERLADTSGPWSIVVSSVVINPMHLDLPGRLGMNRPLPPGYLVTDGIAINTDGWDGYPCERDRLAAALRARGRGGVLLSGDVHSAWAFEGPSDGDGPVAVEFTCPAVTSKPMGEMIPVVGGLVEAMMAAEHGVAWVDLFARGHLVVDIDPESVTGTWYFSDSEDPAAAAQRGSSWTTHLDRPGQLVQVDADPEHPARRNPAERGSTSSSGADHADAASGSRDRTVPSPVPPRPEGVVAAEARHRRRTRLAATVVVTVAFLWWELHREGPDR